MYFQRKPKVKQNRPSFCNYHRGSHATALQIRFTPRNYILNLLAVGMENLLCNGKGAHYFCRVEFERGLWASGLVAVDQMASTLFPSTSILITWLSLLDVGDEFGWADDPASSRAKPCYRTGNRIQGKGWRKAHSVQAFTHRFDRQYLAGRMVIHSRKANP